MILWFVCLLPSASVGCALPSGIAAPDKFIMDCNPSMARVSDLDGDSIDDLIFGSPWAREGYGQVWVVSGANDKVLGTMVGNTPRRLFGQTVSAVADVDGDGLSEILVWSSGQIAWGSDAELPSCMTLISSRNYEPLWQCDFKTSLDVSSMGSMGDVNADGLRDLWVGIPNWFEENSRTGAVLVVSAKNGQVLRRKVGAQSRQHFGDTVCVMGDTNGDGFPDLAASSYSLETEADAKSKKTTKVERISVLSGKDLTDLVEIQAPAESKGFGWAMQAVPDLDDDEVADLLVSAPGCDGCESDAKHGKVYRYSGRTGKVLGSVHGKPWESFGFALATVSGVSSEAPRLWVGAPYGAGWSGTVYEYRLPDFSELRSITYSFEALDLKMGASMTVLHKREGGKGIPHRLVVRGCTEAERQGGHNVAQVKIYSLQTLECEASWKFGETIQCELRPGATPR